jgi:hypothetical protein
LSLAGRSRRLAIAVVIVLAIPFVLLACIPTSADAARRGQDVTFALHAGRLTGSAVYVGDGLFLTAAHVVAAETKFRLVRGKSELAASLVSADFDTDIALLRLDNVPQGLIALPWASELPTGTPVFAIGYPSPLDETAPTVTNGIVSGIRSLDGITYLQLDAPINPGNSGGPVVTQSGQLAGVIVGKIRDSQGLNFAVPAQVARDYVRRPVAKGDARNVASGTSVDSALAKEIHDLINRGNQAFIRAYRSLNSSYFDCCLRGPHLAEAVNKISDLRARGEYAEEELVWIEFDGAVVVTSDGFFKQRTIETWTGRVYRIVDQSLLRTREAKAHPQVYIIQRQAADRLWIVEHYYE